MSQKNSFKGYKITFTTQAKKELDKLEKKAAANIDDKLQKLIEGFPNIDLKKMEGLKDTYRLRSGNDRVIFQAHKQIITIIVIEIVPRKNAYRKF